MPTRAGKVAEGRLRSNANLRDRCSAAEDCRIFGSTPPPASSFAAGTDERSHDCAASFPVASRREELRFTSETMTSPCLAVHAAS